MTASKLRWRSLSRVIVPVAATLTVGALLAGLPADAQFGDPSKVTLKTTPVTGNVTMIEGANGFAGGNVAASVGEDGVLLVDDHLQPLSAKLKAKIATLSRKPIRFVVNTHWHADHSGGNAALGAAGAVLVAQDNVRKRMSVEQFREFMGQKSTVPPSPKGALPVVTFGQDVTLHFNGDEITASHVPAAHTDGDVIVHFKKANVLHMGDLFNTMGYPFADPNSGGQFDGFLAAADRALALANDGTRIIPGHGAIAGRAELQAWRDMLAEVRARVAKLVAAGKTLDEIQAAKPTADLDERYGKGFIKPEQVVAAAHRSVTAAKPAPRR